jgi:hypothetical protein
MSAVRVWANFWTLRSFFFYWIKAPATEPYINGLGRRSGSIHDIFETSSPDRFNFPMFGENFTYAPWNESMISSIPRASKDYLTIFASYNYPFDALESFELNPFFFHVRSPSMNSLAL